jgi:uncharacterized membrane protein YebE (DUF533 family)
MAAPRIDANKILGQLLSGGAATGIAAERAWLAMLAARLDLPVPLVAQLEARAGAELEPVRAAG